VARKKSDAGDALVLAHILRTDQSAHRALPADSELAQAVAVLACAQEDAVWDRTCAHNKLRSLLREYYPGIIAAFADKRHGLLRSDARGVLAAAPTPRAAARLSKTQPRALLRRAGRQRASTPKPTGSRRCSAPSTYINPSCFAVFVDQVPAAAQAARTARVSCGVACSGHGPRNLAAMMTRRSLTAMSS
jgi:hypothetical protein